MSTNEQGQELLIQLETALYRLAEGFWDEPYRLFTEADAVAALQSWVTRRPELAQTQRTADGFKTGLLHREYPTFFRFKKSDPIRRLGPPAGRGHYDLVLIDPTYIRQHEAETVLNRDIQDRGDLSSPPLLAAVEFKLFATGWNSSQVKLVEQDLGKLRLALQSPPDVSTAYFCVFQRDVSPTQRSWERHWPDIEEMLADFSDIGVVVAVCWPQQEQEPFVYYSGPWVTALTG